MPDWNKIREYFPHLPGHLYLNHAAISPMNTLAKAAMEDFWNKRMVEDIEFWPEALNRLQQFKSMIGKLISAPAEQVALVPNTSAGLNILALGIQWRKGDRILLNDFEFPSNVIPFVNLKRHGVAVDFVEHRDGRILLEDIQAAIRPETRLLSISFVEFLNGYRNDLYAIGRLCRDRNIIFTVDGIQGLGALQLDVPGAGIDFLSNGGHKWLMWPAGLGFVYISTRIFDSIYPAQAGWLSVETPWNFFDYQQPFAADARRFEPGSYNVSAIIAATATLDMMLSVGPKQIQQKILANTRYLLSQLDKRGFRLYSAAEENNLSGIVSFFHPRAEKLFEYLKNKQVTISLREGTIRVSPHFYNSTEDLDRFLQILDKF